MSGSAGEALVCEFCGAEFTQPPPLGASAKWRKLGKDSFPPSPVAAHADHEMKCKENPARPEKLKLSSAWTPTPWTVAEFGGAQPNPTETELTYLGGPWHGRKQQWDAHLVGGVMVTVEPPRLLPGPQMSDSKGRACARHMGHYELRLIGRCPIYRWVPTIKAKKKLPAPRTFTEAWPALAADLEMEKPNDEPTTEHGTEAGPEISAGDMGPVHSDEP